MSDTMMPDWLEPMVATLTEDRFGGDDWLFERKCDGIRLLAYKRKGTRLANELRAALTFLGAAYSKYVFRTYCWTIRWLKDAETSQWATRKGERSKVRIAKGSSRR
jgi:hypothetical protein